MSDIESTESTGEEGTAEEIEPQGFIDKIINVFLDPASLFKWIAIKPDFWTPWIVVCLLSIIITGATFPATKDMRWEQTERSLRMQNKTESEITEAAEKFNKPSTQYIGLATQSVGILIFVPLIWALAAGILYVLSLVQGMNTQFKTVLSVFAFSNIIKVVGDLIEGVIKLGTGASTMEQWEKSFISIAALLPAETHRAIIYPVSLFNPFFIWSMVALVIGLTTIHKSKTSSSVITVVIFVIVLVLVRIGLGFLMHLFAGGGDNGGNVSVEVS